MKIILNIEKEHLCFFRAFGEYLREEKGDRNETEGFKLSRIILTKESVCVIEGIRVWAELSKAIGHLV